MERKYFEINENLAFSARRMWSFRDYVKGTITATYIKDVNEVYNIVEKIQTEKPKNFEKAYKYAVRYAKLLAEWYNKKHSIDMMCPSIMISGGGNFPIRKKEKQNESMDRHYKYYEYINNIPVQINNMLYGNGIIKSGDSDAIEQLEEKIRGLEELQQTMKDANAYFRKHKTLVGFTGLSERQINELMEDMKKSWSSGKPFASYSLTNNNSKIKAAKARLDNLKRIKERGTQENDIETEQGDLLYQVIENVNDMRLQLKFGGKPCAEARDIMKKNGFKWSPKNECWQRQLTNNARYALERIQSPLNEVLVLE